MSFKDARYWNEKTKIFLRNGFDIKLIREASEEEDEAVLRSGQQIPGVVGLEVCAMTKLIPGYGISDLAELLQQVATGFRSDEVSLGIPSSVHRFLTTQN